MLPYAWSCLACEESNAAAEVNCSRCECPARATSALAASARSAYRRGAGLPALPAPDPMAIVKELPLLAIGAVLFVLLGGLMLIVDMGASTTAFGGLLIALAALCVSSYRQPAAAAG